ncbi:MAG: sodium:solute symporter [Planctomycetes bacterium]|nr:sodium:solute symporter [Planctomycetota bacterium]
MSDTPSAGLGVLVALALVIGISGWLGLLAQRVVERGSFVKGFFLGNRGLGTWAMALTATVQSGGTFMGVPSLIYSHGWIVALWIGPYMLVPLTAFSVLGKRLGQLSRQTAAITLPDMFRGRFESASVGLVMSFLIMFYMSFMLVAQFKAGAILMQLSIPGTGALAIAEDGHAALNWSYYLGLIVFAVTVVGYTMAGGFLASVWTDLFQSVLMLVGVAILLLLVIPMAGGLEVGSREAIKQTSSAYVFGPGYVEKGGEFLSPSLAMSMFFIWIFGGMASPASMVRVMATRNTAVLRRSIFCLGTYNLFIYIPLICICVAARALIPNLPAAQSDQIIPRLALLTTHELPGGSFLAGLILAAPFGAVMATVSSFLLVMASGIVRDVYLHFIHPHAPDARVKLITHVVMGCIGLAAVIAVLKPPDYLQNLIVFGTTCSACSLLMPAMMACYWRRATAAGTLASMIVGSLSVWSLYAFGVAQTGAFKPLRPWGLDPTIFGMAASCVLGIGVSLLTRPPREELLRRLFDESDAPAPSTPSPR